MEVWKDVDLHHKTKGRPADLGCFSFPAASPGPRTLNESKVHDSLSMFDFIPPDVYRQLVSGDVNSDTKEKED